MALKMSAIDSAVPNTPTWVRFAAFGASRKINLKNYVFCRKIAIFRPFFRLAPNAAKRAHVGVLGTAESIALIFRAIRLTQNPQFAEIAFHINFIFQLFYRFRFRFRSQREVLASILFLRPVHRRRLSMNRYLKLRIRGCISWQSTSKIAICEITQNTKLTKSRSGSFAHTPYIASFTGVKVPELHVEYDGSFTSGLWSLYFEFFRF